MIDEKPREASSASWNAAIRATAVIFTLLTAAWLLQRVTDAATHKMEVEARWPFS